MDELVQSGDKNPLTTSEIATLTKETLFQTALFERLYQIEDEVERALMKQALEERAKELGKGLVTQLRNIFKTCERNYPKLNQQARERPVSESTDFREITGRDANGDPIYGEPTPYDGFLVPDDWMISNDGIYRVGAKNITAVCGRPVLPVAIWRNLENQREKAVLAHKVKDEWRTLETPRSTISTSSLLTKLSDFGLDANSKNATNLIGFFSDFINCNAFSIPVYFTTSKLGWKPKKGPGGTIEYNFIPYYKGVKFDAESSFMDLFSSIGKRGSAEKWLSLTRGIRERKPLAPRVALAASFASALIYPLGILGFFVDIYGTTGGGKTITLMLACSVWANPNENKYIGDFSATRTALETRLDMLNSLPLMVDDTSKKAPWVNYEYTIYDLTSGKGKTRSNTNLGNEPEKTWKDIVICNGEHAISDQVIAVGAKNRVIEVPCEDHLFENPWMVLESVKANYGHAGELFIEAVRGKDWAQMREHFLEIQERFAKHHISGKQASSGAALLLADEIATECVFKDGHPLTFSEIERLLLKENEISEGADCYQYLLDIIEANSAHFEGAPGGPYPSCEKWGAYDIYQGEDGAVYISWYITFYKKKLEEGGYSRKQFADWARLNDVLVVDKGSKDTKVVKVNGKSQKYVIMRVDHDILKRFYERILKDGYEEDDGPEQEPVKPEELDQMSLGDFEETKTTPFDVEEPIFD